MEILVREACRLPMQKTTCSPKPERKSLEGRETINTDSDMEKDYVLSVADTIRQQLMYQTPMAVLCSWGALHGFIATVYKGMATLMFKVNGRLFKGHVLIAYNEMDYYEIYLKDNNGIRQLHPEVYFDQLCEVIDEAIERGDNPEEYAEFCAQEKAKLLRGEIG